MPLFASNVDLGGNQLKNAAIQSASADPPAPNSYLGMLYYNTGSAVIKVCTNASTPTWVALSSGGGTVTSVSVASANGFAGSSSGGATPALTLSTSITGVLKGNGTAISAAVSGTDYAPATSGTSILKANGSGGFSSAASGTDYAPATSGTSILKGSGSGGFSNASAGTDYLAPTGSGASLTGITESQVTNLTTDLAAKAPLASPSLTGTPVAPTATAGTNTTQIATTQFVQTAANAAAQGINAKASAVVVTTANSAQSGLLTVDGVTLTAGQRVLSIGQTTSSQNGLWLAASGAWTRPTDFASASSQTGTFVFVESGTANSNSGWVLSGATAVTVDTTAQTWVQFSGAGELTAGSGIGISGNTISVNNPLNQNTTGTAANVTGTVALANGGTGQTSAQAAINSLLGGTMTAGLFARANGTNFVAAALQAADIPTNAAVTPASPGTGTKYALVYNSGLISASSTTLTVTHNLNNANPIVQVWNSSGAVVYCDIATSSANVITLTFATAPATNTILCTVTG
jgi:hypothetical protein